MSRYILSPHSQGSPEWLQDRAGKVTGSRAADMLAKTAKGEWSAKRRDYCLELSVERLTGQPEPQGFVSREMQWGIDQEPFARLDYEMATGNLVKESGFMYLPDLPVGCSVDGLFNEGGKTGLWEAKCPKSTTHIKYLEAQALPPEYKPQVLHNLWVTGAEFADFVSFDPRLPESVRLFIVRYVPTADELAEHEAQVMAFLAEVDATVERITSLGKAA